MEDKFSVIIPTLLRSIHLESLLYNLQQSCYVDEIILIDNTGSYRSSLSKVRVLTRGENIFVNPAWNLGVREARNENLCICNDDINFNPDVFLFISLHIDKGVIGLDTSNYYLSHDVDFTIESIKERCWGWGCCFFIKKSNYKYIPEQMKIACGDDFLIKHIPAFVIKGLKISWTSISTTSFNKEFLKIQEEDLNYFKTL